MAKRQNLPQGITKKGRWDEIQDFFDYLPEEKKTAAKEFLFKYLAARASRVSIREAMKIWRESQ